MDKKVIDDIVWYVSFKKLRNALRIYLYELIAKNNELNNISLQLNNISDKLYSDFIYKVDYNSILSLISKESIKQSVEYISNNGSNARIFVTKEELLKFVLEEYVKTSNYTNKLFLEFGVYSGHTINFCSSMFENTQFYGFDSFEGLPETQSVWTKGEFDLKGNLPKVNKNVSLIKGYFSDTLPNFLKEHKEKISFMHIDCDLYSSSKSVFDNVYDRIEAGTVIQFDEYYNYPGWKNHEYKAFQEFCQKYQVEYEYIGVSVMQVAVVIKSIKN